MVKVRGDILLAVTFMVFIFSDFTSGKSYLSSNISQNDTICKPQYVVCKDFADKEGNKHLIIDEIKEGFEVGLDPDNEYEIECKSKFFAKIFLNKKVHVSFYDVIECPEDCFISYIPNSLTITDIDNNGIKEITFLYKMSCNTDVVPAEMKLMMSTMDQKYKIRGSQSFFYDEPAAFNIDPSFRKAPLKFLDHAVELWNKNLYDDRYKNNISEDELKVYEKLKNKNIEVRNEFVQHK